MISAKGEYALEIMIYLARRRGELTPVSLLSDALGISQKYLEQLMSMLRRAGYVRSVRGALGGYRLSGNAEQYRVGDILRLMEGLSEPKAYGGEETKEMWRRVEQVLDGYTIARLAYKD